MLPAVVTPPILIAAVAPAIIEAFADADAADIANSNAADARALAAAATSHAITTATTAQSSSLRAAHEIHNLARGMFRSANHRGVQLQATAIAGDMTQRVNVDIVVAQAEIVNPTPPQPQVTHEVAWHSTLNPAAITQDIASDEASVGDDAVEDAAVEHAEGEHAAMDNVVSPLTESTSPPAPTPDTTVAAAAQPPAATTGIMAMLPSITFPWPANSCVASAQRAAQMQANRLANNH